MYFAGFNFLEAGLPARLSVLAEDEVRGASLGVFSSAQFLGAFVGGLIGGRFLGQGGLPTCFSFARCWAASGWRCRDLGVSANDKTHITEIGLAICPSGSTIVPPRCRRGGHYKTDRQGTKMARGINKVIIVGNLGQDPETRYMPSGSAVTNFTVATNESWKDKQTGEQKDRTEWHRVAMFNRLAEIAAEYLRKGSQVYIEGKLRTRKWQGQDGQDRYTTEIIADEMQMLGGRGGGAGGGSFGGGGGQQGGGQQGWLASRAVAARLPSRDPTTSTTIFRSRVEFANTFL